MYGKADVDMDNPNRWKQRFENFEKAYLKLEMVIEHAALHEDDIVKMALIQAFEFTFELAWKNVEGLYGGRRI